MHLNREIKFDYRNFVEKVSSYLDRLDIDRLDKDLLKQYQTFATIMSVVYQRVKRHCLAQFHWYLF